MLKHDAEWGGHTAEDCRRESHVEEQINNPLVYDEQLERRMVDKITMFENRLMVEFKLGLEIDVKG